MKRQLIKNVTGAPCAQTISRDVRELGRALGELATHEPRAACLFLLSTAEELRRMLRGTDEHKVLLESMLGASDPGLADVLNSVETALLTMVERRPALRDASDRITAVKEMIERRYREPLTIDDVASHVCRGSRHLASQFRRETGSTIHRYLTQVRMRHASEQLELGEKVEAVMLLVGYRSKKSFYTHFRAHTGETPGSFRRRRWSIA